MLGKLFKYEFKESSKRLLPLNLILVAITLAGIILISLLLKTNSFALLSIPCLMIYVLSVFALFVLTAAYLTVRFYRTVYADQAYLTHTLPVSARAIINTKIITALFWTLLSVTLTILSILFLVRAAAGKSVYYEILHTFRYILPKMFGLSSFETSCYLLSGVLFSCLDFILMVCASLAVGQLFQKYRILASIGAGVVFYVIKQIIGVISLLVGTVPYVSKTSVSLAELEQTAQATASQAAIYRNAFLLDLGTTLFYCVAFYIICSYITRKRLNLE